MSRPEPISFSYRGQMIAGVCYPSPQPSGHRVVLNHGFSVTRMGVGRAFVDLANALADAGAEVFAFDRLGHGESDGRFMDVTVPDELKQLSAMIDFVQDQDEGPVHLMGHSLGGMESACLAAQRPDDIASLTLWAAAAVFVDDIKKGEIQGKSLDTARETGIFDFEGQALGLGFVDTAADFDPYDGLDSFKGPAWIHQGASDMVVPMRYAERYAKAWGDAATLYRYPEADHGWNRLADRTLLLQRTVADICGS